LRPRSSRLPHSASLPFAPHPTSNWLMKSFCLFATLFLVFATARADLTIVQTVDGVGQVQHITMKVKGDKARVEIGSQLTTIIDSKTGNVINLMNEKKVAMTIPGENARAMAEMAKSFVKEEAPTQPSPKPTGKKETINGYETQEYVSDSPKFHASYWVAPTYPNYASILQQMNVLKNGAFASVAKGMPDYSALPGMPLRTHVRTGNEHEITSTIESISSSPLPDADFTVPAGYSEMKMPDLHGERPAAKP
jgi:hypothetical protein